MEDIEIRFAKIVAFDGKLEIQRAGGNVKYFGWESARILPYAKEVATSFIMCKWYGEGSFPAQFVKDVRVGDRVMTIEISHNVPFNLFLSDFETRARIYAESGTAKEILEECRKGYGWKR